MASEMEIPESAGTRLNNFAESAGKIFPNPEDHQFWYGRSGNESEAKKLLWSAPYDARFPQTRKQGMCFHYYVDYFRCKELMGEDYKPCKFFENVYKDFCPKYWVERWDEWREEGRFPANFTR